MDRLDLLEWFTSFYFDINILILFLNKNSKKYMEKELNKNKKATLWLWALNEHISLLREEGE